jgi:pyruvate dehydrogenase E2 component (dihydrolipoamide acetyltransferase)
MPHEFKLPDLGEGVSEGQVMRLLVAEGDEVVEDQPLMEVETDKAAVEIPSPYAGKVTTIHVSERQVVNVGDVLVTFSAGNGEETTSVEAKPAEAKRARQDRSSATATAAPPKAPPRRKPASPAVRKLAKRLGVDLETIDGSGPGGRVLREDVEKTASASAEAPTVSPGAKSAETASSARSAPAPVRDVPPPPTVAAPPIQGTEDTDEFGPVIREPLTQTRKTIARVMSHSATTIPHVTDADDADITDLERLRKQYNAQGDRPKLGQLPFFIRAVVRALQMYPIFNAMLDEQAEEIIYKRYYNIAIGVQTERGLVAPVLRDADRLSIPQIGERLTELIERTRRGAFTMDDTRGATYTISNAGAMGGSRYSTPIINHPQVAVLALGRSRWMPWVVEGEIQPRLILPLSHSMDHRVIDGAVEIAFMRQVIGDLENPARILL